MPVVSPSRYTPTSSTLTGSYRSTLTPSSSLDKPYYRNSSGTYVTSTVRSSHGDRTTEYRSRYSEVDGKRERKTSLVEYTRSSRAPSAGDSDNGISGRSRAERSESRSRDVSTTRSESSRTADLNRGKRNVLSTTALAMSTVDFYKKYSPTNYVPMTQRIQAQAQNSCGEIARSKSISSDIGRPPAADCRPRRARHSAATIAEVPRLSIAIRAASRRHSRFFVTQNPYYIIPSDKQLAADSCSSKHIFSYKQKPRGCECAPVAPRGGSVATGLL